MKFMSIPVVPELVVEAESKSASTKVPLVLQVLAKSKKAKPTEIEDEERASDQDATSYITSEKHRPDGRKLKYGCKRCPMVLDRLERIKQHSTSLTGKFHSCLGCK